MEHLLPYIPIGVVLVVAIGFAAVNLLLGQWIGPKRPNPAKELPYESGMIPEGEANVRVPVKFYMVALLFLLFDIEGVFILIWAVVFRGNHPVFESEAVGFTVGAFQRFAFLEMLVFMAILVVGYLYAWRKGGFRWS